MTIRNPTGPNQSDVVSDWPFYGPPVTVPPDSVTSIIDNRIKGIKSVGNLHEGQIYAFQVNYEIPGALVFSARDAYVWASDEPPDGRVATFPSFGRHADRTFEYVICDWTFDDPNTPMDEGAQWVVLINDAFGQWQTALDDFITVRPKPGAACPIGPRDPTDQLYPEEMETFLMIDDNQNNVRMFDDFGDKGVFAYPELKADVFKVCLDPPLLRASPACVTSFRDYSGLDDEETERRRGEIDRTIQKYLDDEISYKSMVSTLTLALQGSLWFSGSGEFDDAIRGVDVSFRMGAFPGSPAMPSSSGSSTEIVRFNSCLDNGNPDILDSGSNRPFHPYALAVHEAGHALGLSGFNRGLLFNQGYAISHPTIPESVLNYDRNSEGRPHWVPSDYREPDCSPHPFDVMAVYALYQSP